MATIIKSALETIMTAIPPTEPAFEPMTLETAWREPGRNPFDQIAEDRIRRGPVNGLAPEVVQARKRLDETALQQAKAERELRDAVQAARTNAELQERVKLLLGDIQTGESTLAACRQEAFEIPALLENWPQIAATPRGAAEVAELVSRVQRAEWLVRWLPGWVARRRAALEKVKVGAALKN